MTDESHRKVLEYARAEMLEYAHVFRRHHPRVTQFLLMQVLHQRFVDGKNPLGFAAGMRATGRLIRLPQSLEDMGKLVEEEPAMVADFLEEVANAVIESEQP